FTGPDSAAAFAGSDSAAARARVETAGAFADSARTVGRNTSGAVRKAARALTNVAPVVAHTTGTLRGDAGVIRHAARAIEGARIEVARRKPYPRRGFRGIAGMISTCCENAQRDCRDDERRLFHESPFVCERGTNYRHCDVGRAVMQTQAEPAHSQSG